MLRCSDFLRLEQSQRTNIENSVAHAELGPGVIWIPASLLFWLSGSVLPVIFVDGIHDAVDPP